VDLSFLVVAGGSGTRMQTPVPKQFLELKGKAVLMHTLQAVAKAAPAAEIVLVLPPDSINYWNELCSRYHFGISHRIVAGGASRFESVRNGLSPGLQSTGIAIHDGVRPFLSPELLQRLYQGMIQYGNAIPVIPLSDSVREITANGSRPADRSRLFTVQTPQLFNTAQITQAYMQVRDSGFTDDAGLFEAAGHAIHLVEGDRSNIKITSPEDFRFAAFLLREKETGSL